MYAKEMTTQDVAEKLGVDRQEAYSLVSFLEKRGFIKAVAVKKPENGKGKGATIFQFNENTVNDMHDLLVRLLG